MEEFRQIYEREFNTVWHICLSYMHNEAEAEDALQETFLRFMKFLERKENPFGKSDNEDGGEGVENIKNKKIRSWLIKTAGNVCKDQLKSWWRKRETYEEAVHAETTSAYEPDYMIELIRKLPDRYKIPVYMYYYLGYDSREIADILKMSGSNVRSILNRARHKLKNELEKQGITQKGGIC